MIFYNLQGNEITREEFIELYNNIYYYLNPYVIEKKIEEIYNQCIDFSYKDLVCFLKWKVGDKSQDETIVTQYGKVISTDEFDELLDIINGKRCQRAVDSIFEEIVGKKIKYIGSVYALALVSLAFRGQEPIYDKYADTALNAINNPNIQFRGKIEYKELPDKEKLYDVLLRYEEYKEKLRQIFGDDWKRNRDIDRALWTYGHLFEINIV